MPWYPIPDDDLAPYPIPESCLRYTKLRGKKLCLAREKGVWHALDNRCPHAGGPLAQGKIEDGQVLCPWHRFPFDLKTGQCSAGGYFVNVYPVKEEKGQLWVELEKRWWEMG